MYQYNFSMQALYLATIKCEEEEAYVSFWSVESFQLAIVALNQAGLSSEQVQLLQGVPFSRFNDCNYTEVLLLALAIKKGTTTIDELHKHLQEKEYWAHIHGSSICIETESLPNVTLINSYLGLKHVCAV